MRLYQSGARLTGARSELIPHAGVLVEGTRIVAAGPLDELRRMVPDRKYGSDFDPAVVEEIAAAGIYVCPTMNAHAVTLRDRPATHWIGDHGAVFGRRADHRGDGRRDRQLPA